MIGSDMLHSLITQVTNTNKKPENCPQLKPQSFLIIRVTQDEIDSLLNASSKAKGFLLPPQDEANKGRMTLVLDLDETLVHSSFNPVDNVDIVLPVIFKIKFRWNLKEKYFIYM